MRLKKPRVYQPDFEQLLVRSELLKDSIAAQLAGEFYTTRALMPHAQREPECTLAVVPYQQTELHTAGSSQHSAPQILLFLTSLCQPLAKFRRKSRL